MSKIFTSNRQEIITVFILAILALSVRMWQLDSVPPGWRDDELINSLVISQKALNGDWRVYYADASGHEGLYHILNAGFLALFGATPNGIRLLSALLGTWTIVSTYRLSVQFFRRPMIAIFIALSLCFSFWSLMYSRTGIRHIALPAFVLPAIFHFWQMLKIESADAPNEMPNPLWHALWGALFLGLSFYTYFASRGAPLILIAFLFVLLWSAPHILRQRWKPLILFFCLSLLMAIPLIITLRAQPESEARVAELAVPIVEAQAGNFQPLLAHVRITLGMFHATGDGEFLYNIPGRPVFGPIGALFFWSGIAISMVITIQLFLSGWRFWVQRAEGPEPQAISSSQLVYPFLILWWLAGISPGFLSVPPASLGHTILALPATYMIALIPVVFVANRRETRDKRRAVGNREPNFSIGPSLYALLLPLVFLLSVGARDLPAYFIEWPTRGQTRFLYRADLRELAAFAQDEGIEEIAIGGLLAGPWDKLAFESYASQLNYDVAARWYDPARVLFLNPSETFVGYPRTLKPFDDQFYNFDLANQTSGRPGEYDRAEINTELLTAQIAAAPETCFENNLCLRPLIQQGEDQILLDLYMRVDGTLKLAPFALISNPPPPDVYAGPRLLVFAQLLDAEEVFV
ncbi:MAG: hypothetical protein AAF633_23020, partial [Chloroflexota bacterium]